MPANVENSAVAQDWKRSVFIPIPKKGNAKEYSNYCTIVLLSHASKIMLKILQAMFSSKSFVVSGLAFRSLIQFELIFVYFGCVRKCSNFIPLHVAVQFSQHHLLKRLSLSHCIFLPSLSKIRYP